MPKAYLGSVVFSLTMLTLYLYQRVKELTIEVEALREDAEEDYQDIVDDIFDEMIEELDDW